jgi:hypothetical protein
MQNPGPAANTIVASVPSQTSSGFVASDDFVFNFARSDHIMTEFHSHSDVLPIDESIFANALAISNFPHEDGHGNPVVAVDDHGTTVLKAHLHVADFHFI